MQKSKRNLNNWLLLYQKDKIFFQLLIIAVLFSNKHLRDHETGA